MRSNFAVFCKPICFLLICLTVLACKSQTEFTTENLKIVQLTPNTFQHISYLQTERFGKVACNGLIIKNSDEALVLDAPVSDEDSMELLAWIAKELKCSLVGVVATHFHDDCIGGLRAFHEHGIPSYSNELTIDLIDGKTFTAPQIGFKESMALKVGKASVHLQFLGEGHTLDNIVGYFPNEKVLFGGCLVKSANASKGYLGDANIEAWPQTISKIKSTFPAPVIVVPGHGDSGGQELLDYTIALFEGY